MGAGKSTVASVIAKRWGTSVLDLDSEIEKRAGKSIGELFETGGEREFRALERAALAALPAEAKVIALGGGAVVDPESRARILREGTLITLTAPVEELVARVAKGPGRPLLRSDPAGALERLLAERAVAYAEAHAVIETSGRSAESVADEVLSVAEDPPVVVPLGERTYRVEIGRGVRGRVAARAVEAAPGRAIVVHDGGSDRPWPAEVISTLEAAGRAPISVKLEGDEAHKTIESVEAVWDATLAQEVDRNAVMIGVGGGVIGDLTAFAASTLLRGVALGQVPTTLLAMVDSSVGGKTGFNRAQGKNLVGTFYQPRFVLCDVDTLGTLPDAERIAGLAEVAKSAWLDGEASVRQLESDAQALVRGDPDATIRAIRMSVSLKARIVHKDETEAGTRMLLNLGHTVGHGLEAAAHYQGLRHGEAISLGMVAATRVARHLGKGSSDQAARLSALLDALGLPTDLEGRLGDAALGFIGADKKRRGDAVHFVVPGEPGETQILPIGLDQLRQALVAS